MLVNQRIRKLRELMKDKGIDIYIEITSDPHQSEYVADYYKGREFLTGFKGSAGTALVTEDKAILWTDGRYFIQAEKEIKNTDFVLYKMNIKGYPSMIEWLKENAKDGYTIGFNGEVFSEELVEKIIKELNDRNFRLHDQEDLVGLIWDDRPQLNIEKVFKLGIEYTGESTKDKISRVRKYLELKKADYLVLASLDDIAWLYNIRGRDVLNNPVVISYALISMDKANLYIDNRKLSEEVKKELEEETIHISEYLDIFDDLKNLEPSSCVMLDKSRINRKLYTCIPSGCNILNEINITTKYKAIKNSIEIENLKIAYRKDTVALTKFFYWIDKNVYSGDIDEFYASEKLEEFRKEQEGFIEPSFDTISAYQENAAMMHYNATKEKKSKILPKGLYLVDSGGQYYNGTTDITRTVAVGEVTEEEKKDFTLCLKGHINLMSAKFLYGSTGHSIDILARIPLWKEGIDYKSGTGHGVGYLLSVHEGPQRISQVYSDVALEEGMVTTVEPGVYKEGKYGIRMENVGVIKKDILVDNDQFMSFEVLSYCFIDRKCIDKSLLTNDEISWINEYHKKTYELLSPYLNNEEREWLKEKTREI
ncbi:MAG: aminopeptidase P family protein [Tissierellales bacterium]|nr:aminopeptidase P family protein [Tissierellales bacterium]